MCNVSCVVKKLSALDKQQMEKACFICNQGIGLEPGVAFTVNCKRRHTFHNKCILQRCEMAGHQRAACTCPVCHARITAVAWRVEDDWGNLKWEQNTIEEYMGLELRIAVREGNIARLNQLIAAGANVNAVGGAFSETGLTWAAREDGLTKDVLTLEMLHALLAAPGLDLNVASKIGGDTPLHWVARHGRLDLVQALLAAGANVNAADLHGTTPLMWAARNGHLPTVLALLVAQGVDVNAANERGETALTLAAGTDVVVALLRSGARVVEGASGMVKAIAEEERRRRVGDANMGLTVLHRAGMLYADLLPLVGRFTGAQGEQVRRREARSLTNAALSQDAHQVRQMLNWATQAQVQEALAAVRQRLDSEQFRGVIELLEAAEGAEGGGGSAEAKRQRLEGGGSAYFGFKFLT